MSLKTGAASHPILIPHPPGLPHNDFDPDPPSNENGIAGKRKATIRVSVEGNASRCVAGGWQNPQLVLPDLNHVVGVKEDVSLGPGGPSDARLNSPAKPPLDLPCARNVVRMAVGVDGQAKGQAQVGDELQVPGVNVTSEMEDSFASVESLGGHAWASPVNLLEHRVYENGVLGLLIGQEVGVR